jgi:hypothetical protein
MHKKIPLRKLIAHAMPLLAVALLAMPVASTAMQHNGHPADTILVQKQVNSKKYKIKLYPNANHQVLFFSASGETGKLYQLFLFNLEGQLVRQVNIRNKETTVLANISKGSYLYEVFSEDDRLENGQVIVR